MSKNIYTIEKGEDAGAAFDEMQQKGIHHLPVVNQDTVVGILSMSDIQKLIYVSEFVKGKVDQAGALQSFSVTEIMTEDVDHIESNKPIEEAAKIFIQKNYSCLPVTENDRLVGIITTTDLLKFYAGFNH